MSLPDYLSSEEAADLLGCSVSQISELVRARRLRAAKIGRGYRFRRLWLDAFLESEADRYQAQLDAEGQDLMSQRVGAKRRALPDLERYG